MTAVVAEGGSPTTAISFGLRQVSPEDQGVVVTTTPGGKQEMTCLPLDYISGFLFGINANRGKTELRERVILYQRECYKVLNEAFRQGRLTSTPAFGELLETDSHSDDDIPF